MANQLYDCVDNAIANVIFAHGAGADMEHQYITEIARKLNRNRLNVLRFNFPYMDKRKQDGKRRPPDRMPTLIDYYQTLLANINSELPVYIAGKSMGGRVAATLAQDKALMSACNVKGVICLGYPFHPAKKPEKLRLEPLQNTILPILILQGERDALGNKEEIKDYNLSSLCQIEYFADGDHDLKPRVKSGFTLIQHQNSAISNISRFIDENN